MKGLVRSIAVGAALITLLGGCSRSGTEATPPSTDKTNQLDVLSWWTSGSEAKALSVLLDDFRAAHPGVNVVNGAVAGGAGSNAAVVLAQRLQAGNPPDVWQTFIGSSLEEYVARGRIADVSSTYAKDKLSASFPSAIIDAVTVDGKQFGVPTGAHRSNMLWYNTAVLEKAGITVPASGYSSAAFLADLEILKNAGVTPLCLGSKDNFTTAELFENILLSKIGSDGWGAIVRDRFDWNGAPIHAALQELDTVLDYADPAAHTVTWDQATRKLATGGCGFLVMNDSVYGELRADGAEEDKDFGYVAYPGTDDQFLAVVDTFVVSQQTPNGQNALDFLTVIGSPKTTLAFNAAKGSVPLRSDVPIDSLSPYQQKSAGVLRNGHILLSIVHGEAMSTAFQQGFYDGVSAFADSGDAAVFVNTLLDTARGQIPPR
ncbi:ABC transporter substrate-binding protein [Rhodococcus opacus]|uniref:Probable sugar-binding periplasmic protein n=1 Tax=Rhodococcus opacus TaxID=37919 RepID=A0A2S8IPA5_RHOOP|nr:ABC transporter substrate-binding protein [Rhodococcus opacus]PQP16519.1 carbohydrate ABC transporter substrate-binding protein [Rhodococcus opacus]